MPLSIFFSNVRTVLLDIISLWLSPRKLLEAWKKSSKKSETKSPNDYKYRTWPVRTTDSKSKWKKRQKRSIVDLSLFRQDPEALPHFYKANLLSAEELETARAVRRLFTISGDISIEKFQVLMRELAPQSPGFLIEVAFKHLLEDGKQLVSEQRFVEFWMNNLRKQSPTRVLYNLMKKVDGEAITGADLMLVVQVLLVTHPSLSFLSETPDFQKRYVETVVERIFYSVNISRTSKINFTEFSKSNLPQCLLEVEKQADINEVSDFFSYVEFYVIFCKFKELDTDNDQLLSAGDLLKYANHSLTRGIVNRIFEVKPTRRRERSTSDKMDYQDFIWFILSEEDKTTRTSLEYWFRCVDIDGMGSIFPYALEHFYREQIQRMESLRIEVIPFEQVLRQIVDMINPKREGRITLNEVKNSKLGGLMFDMLFNLSKFIAAEQSNPFEQHANSKLSDWRRFALEEYQIAVMEQDEQVEEDEDEEEEEEEEDAEKEQEDDNADEINEEDEEEVFDEDEAYNYKDQ